MHYRKEEDFAKAFKTGLNTGLILLYGSENYLVEAWQKRILKRFEPYDGFNMNRLDGRKPDLDELYDATQMLPLMSTEKCVLLENLDPGKLNSSDIEKLGQIFDELPPECILLITTCFPDFDHKSAAGKKLIALVAKAGAVAELGARDKGNMVRFLQSQAKKNGCEIPTSLCHTMLEICETDMQSLSMEMEKLCAFCGQGLITKEQMDQILTPRTEARVFDLSKAILAGNPQRSMEILHDLFYLREAPVAILSTLIMSYVDIYRARVARDTGITEGELSRRFDYKGREFRVRNAYRSRMSVAALRRCLELLYSCDRDLKSSGMDSQLLLEHTVAALLVVEPL